MTVAKNNSHVGRKVRVYFNLHKKTFSVVATTGDNKGRVLFYSDLVSLTDCKFRVQPTGRERVLKEKRKNVHAFAYGTINNIYPWDIPNKIENGRGIRYNPYKYSTFIYSEDETVARKSKEVLMSVSNNKPSIVEI